VLRWTGEGWKGATLLGSNVEGGKGTCVVSSSSSKQQQAAASSEQQPEEEAAAAAGGGSSAGGSSSSSGSSGSCTSRHKKGSVAAHRTEIRFDLMMAPLAARVCVLSPIADVVLLCEVQLNLLIV